MVTEKRCSVCDTVKPAAGFYKDRRGKDGLVAQCKRCRSEKDREYRLANRDRIAEKDREYHQQNREKRTEQMREYRQANLDRIAEKQREYRQANRDRISEYKRTYWESNRDQMLDNKREYYYGITGDQYRALILFQRGECAGCGTTECPTGKALSVDHDHDCCPPAPGKTYPVGACGGCVRGLLCVGCNFHDRLAGYPSVDWGRVMAPLAA